MAEVQRLLHGKNDARSAWTLLELIAPAAARAGSFEFTYDVMVEQVRVLNYLGVDGKTAAKELYAQLQPLLRAARATRLEQELDQIMLSPPVLRTRARLTPQTPSGYSQMAMKALLAQKLGAAFPMPEELSLLEASIPASSLTKPSRSAENAKLQAKAARKRERIARRKQRKRN